MLTIGYGDISPKSVGEKCVTIVIEIVGNIVFIQESLLLDICSMKWGIPYPK